MQNFHRQQPVVYTGLVLVSAYLVASMRGVQPVLVWWFTFEFLSISRDTTSSCPFQQARVRGVSSLLPEGTLIWAPESRSNLVAS